MPRLRIDKIGLVSHFSQKGDWAFNLAFHLAKSHSFQLNIFNFMESPFEISNSQKPSDIKVNSNLLDEKKQIEAEKILRKYYDELLDDYVDVGFRVCISVRHNLELRRCLIEKEYQVLVIPYLKEGIRFGNMPIEEFAYRFISPVILVGPNQPDSYHINNQARLIIDSLNMPGEHWNLIETPKKLQNLPVI